MQMQEYKCHKRRNGGGDRGAAAEESGSQTAIEARGSNKCVGVGHQLRWGERWGAQKARRQGRIDASKKACFELLPLLPLLPLLHRRCCRCCTTAAVVALCV
jgi:hypothetical protein